VETGISLLSLQTQRVNLVVYLATLPKLAIMLQLVGAITFDILGPLNSTKPYYMPLLPAVLAL